MQWNVQIAVIILCIFVLIKFFFRDEWQRAKKFKDNTSNWQEFAQSTNFSKSGISWALKGGWGHPHLFPKKRHRLESKACFD